MIKNTSRLFKLFSTTKPTYQIQSFVIVNPHFYQRNDLFSKIQNYFTNRSILNDMQRSLKNFKRTNISTDFLIFYNQFIHNVKKQKYRKYQDHIAPTLAQQFKKKTLNKQQLPYYFLQAKSCELVQARAYSQNIKNLQSLNKWYQLTLKYTSTNGQQDYHVVQRNDKLKSFKFIKFYL